MCSEVQYLSCRDRSNSQGLRISAVLYYEYLGDRKPQKCPCLAPVLLSPAGDVVTTEDGWVGTRLAGCRTLSRGTPEDPQVLRPQVGGDPRSCWCSCQDCSCETSWRCKPAGASMVPGLQKSGSVRMGRLQHRGPCHSSSGMI